jgi:hypothetical protein
MYNDTRVHRVNLSTVLSAQASIFRQADRCHTAGTAGRQAGM